jgi:hypothetical protein
MPRGAAEKDWSGRRGVWCPQIAIETHLDPARHRRKPPPHDTGQGLNWLPALYDRFGRALKRFR